MAYVAYKFRLVPSKDQARELRAQLETLRQVYNAALGYWSDFREETKVLDDKTGRFKYKSPTDSAIYKVFSSLRNAQIADKKAGGSGPFWLTNVSAVSVRDTCVRVKKSFDRFLSIMAGKIKIPKPRRPRKDGKPHGYPRFKPYDRLTSIPFENYNSGCVLRSKDGKSIKGDTGPDFPRRGCRLDLFGVGRVKVVTHRPIVGEIKTACVEREPDGKWHVVLVAKVPDVDVPQKEGPDVGIDVGLSYFLTTSDGEEVENPKYLKAELKALRRAQRSASRKKEAAKSSGRKFRECQNLKKSYHKLAVIHGKVKRKRKDHHYKTSNRLVRRYATVCVEKLNVLGMLRNGKLSRAIQDAGWSGFLGVLKQSSAKSGTKYVEVDAYGSSQVCPECWGAVKKTLSVRNHVCPHCGYRTSRDHAAARVILARGLNLDGPGRGPAGLNPTSDSASGAEDGCPTNCNSSPKPLLPSPRERSTSGAVNPSREKPTSRGKSRKPLPGQTLRKKE